MPKRKVGRGGLQHTAFAKLSCSSSSSSSSSFGFCQIDYEDEDDDEDDWGPDCAVSAGL